MNAIATEPDCGQGGLDFEEARRRVLALATEALPPERVPVAGCVGRVLAGDVAALLDLPRFDQSAMDGYAVRAADVTPGAWLPVTGRTAAGEAGGRLAPGGAHRILTGAPLPAGADAVIARERARRAFDAAGGHGVVFAVAPPPGTNLRRRGEDTRAGDTLVAAGTVLDWRHVAVLAAQGIGEVQVLRRPRVALLSSGRELRGSGERLAEGQVHDSNLPMLAALLPAWGAQTRRLPVAADSVEAVRAALGEAADCDVVVTTAGISVGDEDHVRDAVLALGGSLCVMKVAMKPGKPLAAGRLGDALFLGLPGNPQAALAGAVGFLRPLLARLAGAAPPAPLRARADFNLSRKPGRTEFLPVRLVQRGAIVWASRAGPEGSGRLSPLLRAHGLAILAPSAAEVRRGALLDVHPFLAAAIETE